MAGLINLYRLRCDVVERWFTNNERPKFPFVMKITGRKFWWPFRKHTFTLFADVNPSTKNWSQPEPGTWFVSDGRFASDVFDSHTCAQFYALWSRELDKEHRRRNAQKRLETFEKEGRSAYHR